MKKYLVAALVACLGILSVNAQVDKTIEVSQCEACLLYTSDAADD